ncbi:MAG: CAP domain-containing protein [Oscillospiraceae bacterium]|nr:CAP domain-containing protein [Oscillospiraceae bacterium]
MHLLKKSFQALVVMFCLLACFSFLTLEARAYKFDDMPKITKTDANACALKEAPKAVEEVTYEPENAYETTEEDEYAYEQEYSYTPEYIPEATPDYFTPPAAEAYTPPAPPVDDAVSVMGDPFANEIIRLINIERFHHGVAPVEMHPVLNQGARIRSQESSRIDDMRFVNHMRPDGQQWHTVFSEMNLCRASASIGLTSENVARGFCTPDQVVRAWMASPEHRYNILSSEWVTTGLGVSVNDWGRIDVVQLFCDAAFKVKPGMAAPYQPTYHGTIHHI